MAFDFKKEYPFEDIEVKQNAPELLEKALKSKRKKCMIGTGAMSDPYMLRLRSRIMPCFMMGNMLQMSR